MSARQLEYGITFTPGARIAPPSEPPISTIDVALDDILDERISDNRHFFTKRIGNDFEIRAEVRDGVLAVLVPVEWGEVQVGQIKITRKIREQ